MFFLTAIFTLLLFTTGQAASQPIKINTNNHFIVLGDMPYTPEQQALLTPPNGVIITAIQTIQPAFILHVGDFKAGQEPCTDELLTTRRNQIAAYYPGKIIYTPGDNDWTDCDRKTLSIRFDELERLQSLRRLFFTDPQGQAMTAQITNFQRQPDFMENAQWSLANHWFFTLHIPGTNNGRDEILHTPLQRARAEYQRREQYNLKWITQQFQHAKIAAAQAIIIGFQADIYHPAHLQPCQVDTQDKALPCDGYQTIRTQLEYQAAQAAPTPVLLIHGDTSAFCLDRPAAGLAPHLWRLNTAGDYTVLEAVQITINTLHPDTPFTAKTVPNGLPPPAQCTYARHSP